MIDQEPPVSEPLTDVFVFKADGARHFVRPSFRSKPNRDDVPKQPEPKFAIRRKFQSEPKRTC